MDKPPQRRSVGKNLKPTRQRAIAYQDRPRIVKIFQRLRQAGTFTSLVDSAASQRRKSKK